MMINLLVPVLCILFFLWRCRLAKQRGRLQTTAERLLFAGIAVYCTGMACMLLLPVQLSVPFSGAQWRVHPFETTVGFVRDILRNGIFVRDSALSDYLGISRSFYNLLGNTLLFVPLGLLLKVWNPALKWRQAILFSVLIPLFVEIWQAAFCRGRTADVDDVILNSVSIGVGFLLAACILWRTSKKKTELSE